MTKGYPASRVAFHPYLELAVVGGKSPRLGKDVVFFGKETLKAIHVTSQKIFAANLAHSGKMVDFLWQRPKKCL